jgi:hypothetical protein
LKATQSPGQVIVQHLFPAHFQLAVDARDEWLKHRRLSILYILLRARAVQEESATRSESLADRWRCTVLSLERRQMPFGYRVVNFLGYDAVDDREAYVARMIFNAILDVSPPVVDFLRKSYLLEVLFAEMKSYAGQLLEQEHVQLGGTPLGSLATFFACLILIHCREKVMLEDRDSHVQKALANALTKLASDIQGWTSLKNGQSDTSWISDMFQEANSGFRGAFATAQKVQNAIEAPKELRIKGAIDLDDGYFSRQRGAVVDLLHAAAAVLSVGRSAPSKNESIIAMVLSLFPQLENVSPRRTVPDINLEAFSIDEVQSFLEGFAPLVSRVDSNRVFSCTTPPIHVAAHESNVLIGDHATVFTFLLSEMTADLGVHISTACPDSCGGIVIENLSTEMAVVELVNPVANCMTAVLKSREIPSGGQIQIAFDIGACDRPMMSWCSCDIIAESVKQPSMRSLCQLRAFVRCCPNVAVIESPRAFLFDGHSWILAPSGYQDQIKLVHRLPKASLSNKSLGLSLAPAPHNATNPPSVVVNGCSIDFQFETRIAGLTAGNLIVRLGSSLLYTLPFRVLVSNVGAVGLYHPASPDSKSVKLAG